MKTIKKHLVQCMDCEKTERIEVTVGQKVESGWVYWGKIDVNSCQTNKFFWGLKDNSKGFCDKDNMKKVPNSCYDPRVKPKFVEMWECPECSKKEVAEHD